VPSPLRTRREALGLSQAQLAAQASIARPYLSQLEACVRQPSLRLAKRLAALLGLSVDELFGSAPPAPGTSGEPGDCAAA
jgi:transcriptional regulator with XRE-family HTH domain